MDTIQYISDAQGNPTGVIVPIELWQQLIADNETHYLLQSEAMKKRLQQARQRTEGIPFEQVREQLGI
jgi:hypothetical protein